MCGFAAAALAVPLAHAQDAPAPSAGASPVIVTPQRIPQQMPGVIPERFSIAPAASPSPTPAPVPTPSATPSASTPRQERTVRATPVPRVPAPMAVSTPTPTPVTVPSPIATAAASQLPQPAAVPQAEPAAATPPWVWAAAGAGGTALLGFGAWLLFWRRRPEDAEEQAFEPAPVIAAPPPEPVPPVPAAPVAGPSGGEPFELQCNPHRIAFGEREIHLEFELLVGNASGALAENIRIAFAAMSAHARQDDVIAGFHGGPPGTPGGEPFDLPAGGGGRLPVRLAIPRSGVNVVEVGGRPMFVPIVLIDLRWRGGLSIRRFGMDFILGTAGQGDKLGPIWLDRPAPSGPLASHRYFAREVAAA
jgi:hypothetical protein